MTTVADFKLRYPAFAPVDDALVNAVLADALDEVSRFPDSARARGAMLYTAHVLSLQGEPSRSAQAAGGDIADADAASRITREKVGDVEVQYTGTGTAAQRGLVASGATGLHLTPYGAQFAHLLRRYIPTILAV